MQCCDDDDGVERPAETAKEKAAREAREKKEKAQELIRKREAEEAAQNLGILFGCIAVQHRCGLLLQME